MLRPGATGIRTSGTSTPRMRKVSSRSPRRSYSLPASQRSSWMTSSTFLESRIEETP